MGATIDAAIDDNDGILPRPVRVTEHVQVKTCGERQRDKWGDDGTDDVPEEVLIQCQHEMAVVGSQLVHVPVLIAGQELRCLHVRRNENLIDAIIEKESEFWRCVQLREAPEPDWGHHNTARLISAMYRPVEGEVVSLGADALEVVAIFEDCKAKRKVWDESAAEMKGRLIRMLGRASVGELPDGRRVTRNEVVRSAYQVEATSFIDLRISKPKKVRATT